MRDTTILICTNGRESLKETLVSVRKFWRGSVLLCFSGENKKYLHTEFKTIFYHQEPWDMLSAREYGVSCVTTSKVLMIDDDVVLTAAPDDFTVRKVAYGEQELCPTFTYCLFFKSDFLQVTKQITKQDRPYFKDGFEDSLILSKLKYRWARKESFPIIHNSSENKWYGKINLEEAIKNSSDYCRPIFKQLQQIDKGLLPFHSLFEPLLDEKRN
jgi:hypothetical protein